MDVFSFYFFSCLEGLGLFYLMLALFRYKLKDYFLVILFITLVQADISFRMRGHELGDYVPIISTLLLVLFNYSVLRMSAVWSLAVAMTGLLAFSCMQILLLFMIMGVMGDVTLVEVQANAWSRGAMQFFTFLLCYGMGKLLIQRGIGFAFCLQRFQWRGENITICMISIVAAISLSALFFQHNMVLTAFTLTIILLVLIYYQVRTEINYWLARKVK